MFYQIKGHIFKYYGKHKKISFSHNIGFNLKRFQWHSQVIHGDNLKKFALNPLCLMSHNEIYEISKPNKNISLSKAHEMLQYMKTLELVQPHCWFHQEVGSIHRRKPVNILPSCVIAV